MVRSFNELDRRALMVLVAQLVFVITYFLFLVGLSRLFEARIESLSGAAAQQSFLSLQDMLATIPLQQLLGLLFSYAVAVVVITIFYAPFFEWLTWRIIYSRRMSARSYLNYVWMSLLWFLIWGAVATLLYLFIREGWMPIVLFMVLMPLAVYLSLILNAVYARTDRVFMSVRGAFALGIGKLGRFIIPIIAAMLVLLVLMVISWTFAFLPPRLEAFMLTVVLLLYSVWLRFYASVVVQPLNELKKYK